MPAMVQESSGAIVHGIKKYVPIDVFVWDAR